MDIYAAYLHLLRSYLKPAQNAELIDKLLSSLNKPDKDIDELWAKETESRIDAHERGRIKAVSLERVLKRRQPPVESTRNACSTGKPL
jgi:putative addiction module component (TIGR02574 family)